MSDTSIEDGAEFGATMLREHLRAKEARRGRNL